MMINGLVINGPYALITTAVSADLGGHESLKGNSKAMATVSAVIDGTGSIGAALGPFIAGALSSWDSLFYLLMTSVFIASLCLSKLAMKEFAVLTRAASYSDLPTDDPDVDESRL